MPHGQEIYLFFYRFGTKGLLGIIICNIIMAIIIYKTLKILYENNIKVLSVTNYAKENNIKLENKVYYSFK